MHLPGHLAMGYLVAAGPALARRRPPNLGLALFPAVVGAITPDLIDKTLQHFELITHSRGLGHSLIFLALLLIIWTIADHRRLPWSVPFGWWTAGVGSHLAMDLLNDLFRSFEGRGIAFTGWIFWPFADHRTFEFTLELMPRLHPRFTILEIGLFALTTAVAVAHLYQRQTTLD